MYREAFERSVAATAALGIPDALARALVHVNAGYLSDTLARDARGDRELALATLWAIWSSVLARDHV